jgi:xanthine dehydrogenase accessory factor
MLPNYLSSARQLQAEGKAFVLATVVRAERPTSAKVGSKALITADGELTGWVGGSCAEPAVRRQARESLQDGRPRLLRLCPPEELGRGPQEGVVEIGLTCVSGGTLEIYLEPQLTQPQLVIIGHLATAEALARLGRELGYPITVIGPEANRTRFPDVDRLFDQLDFSLVPLNPNSYVVVASHGNYDELALETALRSEAPYVALVASRKRADAIRGQLAQAGLTQAQIGRMRSPAGLDLGGSSPEELAVSILAEIIQLRHKPPPAETDLGFEQAREARDPVCGMMVEIETAHFSLKHGEQTYYFCSAGCRHRFAAEPAAYLMTS